VKETKEESKEEPTPAKEESAPSSKSKYIFIKTIYYTT
jgi:hypothetical protein